MRAKKIHLLGLLACLLSAPFCAAQSATSAPPLLLGTAWYPEQWPESVWEHDLAQMQAAHMHVVRIAEFAWSSMEPSEGRYEFGWLDHAIAAAAKHDISVVIGTPTAAPPAWLTSKYPETLRFDENGRRDEHGNRLQYSANDPHYRALCAEIARRLAERYGHNPHVLGWQIDNEIGAPTFDESAKQQWHAWLAKKYGNVAELNRRWATAYWSQTYDRFDEVPFHSRGENPALLLDYKHFVTDTWVGYVQNQVQAMRPLIDARQFITTNTMHWYSVYDHYAMHRGLDIAAWDDYVPDGHLDPPTNAIAHDLVRGYKNKNFWLMETQPAFVNWGAVNTPLPPGVTREMAWQAVAHGADAVLYWQWRSAPNGQEEYHGTLVGADDEPQPVYAEIQQLGADFAKTGAALAGTSPHGSVAFLQDYDSHWAIDFQKHAQGFDYTRVMTDWYAAAQPLSDGLDVVSAQTDLARYKVVLAPALNVLTREEAEHLRAYVEAGGTLVLGPRTAMKNGDDGLWPERQPGPLSSALGATVEQFYALDTPRDSAVKVSGSSGAGTASTWAEVLKPTDGSTRTLLTYDAGQTGANGWLAGKPAAVEHTLGKGRIVYLGALVDTSLLRSFLGELLTQAEVKPLLANLPKGVEVVERSHERGSSVWIAINHSNEPQTLTLPHAMQDLLSGGNGASVPLQPHGVAVLLEPSR